MLVGTSEVTVDFLLDIDSVLKELGNKQSYMVIIRPSHQFTRVKLSKHPGKIILFRRLIYALCQPWDIIIFSDHNNTEWFHSSIPKIRCTHGLYSGKTHAIGGSYTYGNKALDHKGNVMYDVMFVESAYVRDNLIHSYPKLRDKLAVVGNMMVDNLLALNPKREAIRQSLGIQDNEKVFIIFSTYGPNSLIQRFGLSLLEELPSIAKFYKTFFLIHPKNKRDEFDHKDTIFELVETHHCNGIAINPMPTEPRMPYLVTADIIITDHTSLALFYLLLEKPIIFVPFLPRAQETNSVMWKFYELNTKYNPKTPLKDQLDNAIKNFPVQAHKQLANLIVDERGKAKERIQTEIAKFW